MLLGNRSEEASLAAEEAAGRFRCGVGTRKGDAVLGEPPPARPPGGKAPKRAVGSETSVAARKRNRRQPEG